MWVCGRKEYLYSSLGSELVAPCRLQGRDFLQLALCIPKVLGPGMLPNQSPALGGRLSWSHFWEALPVQHQRPAAWEAFSTSVAQGWFVNVITRRPFSCSQILNLLFVMDTQKSYSPGFQGNTDQKIHSFIVSGSKQKSFRRLSFPKNLVY